jgi:hypothetical protein
MHKLLNNNVIMHVSESLTLSGVVPTITNLGATSVVLQFEQAAIERVIAQYYGYTAAYWTDPQNITIAPSSVVHDPSLQLQSLSITGLSQNTTYHATILPYRNLYAAFGNAKYEYGYASKTVVFTTSK